MKFKKNIALLLTPIILLTGCKKNVTTLNANGLSMNFPEDFVNTDDYGCYLYHKSFNENADVYINYSSYISIDQPEIQKYNNEQILDFMNDILFNAVSKHYEVANNAFEFNCDYRENTLVLDSQVIYETGLMHLYANTDDIYYAMYYGNIYIKEYDCNCPTYWIAFGTDTPDNSSHITDSIKKVVGSVKYVE